MDGDRHLGRPPLIRMRAQLVADHLFPSAHGGFGPSARVASRPLQPSHAAVRADVRRTSRFDVLRVAVALGRCGLGRVARHGGRAWRDDDGRFRVALGDAGVNAVLVGLEAAATLGRLYGSVRLFVNL